ncbi:MAG TPA: YhjD/YihY/BrkB family envelope integrity protein [Egibacteraceae bacterium]|nr:YhjD/YihY/BrkB family envelope integrity protein [Egibacteraceae bacterium]
MSRLWSGDLSFEDLTNAFVSALKQVKADDVPTLAAGVAFKIFLSIFPSLIAAVAIFSLVMSPARLPALLGRLEGLVPPEVIEQLLEPPLTGLVGASGGAAGSLAVLGVLGGLWSATSAAVTLIKALNRINHVEETRNVVAQRAVALVLTLALLGVIVALIVLVVVGPQVQDWLLPARLEDSPVAVLFGVGQFLVAVALLMGLFAFVYWLGPDRQRAGWQAFSPGAVLGVAGWLALSAGFTLYVQLAGNYRATYGTLAGVIVALLWLQLSMLVLLVGAELDDEIAQLRTRRAAVVRAGFGLAGPDAGPAEPARRSEPAPPVSEAPPAEASTPPLRPKPSAPQGG